MIATVAVPVADDRQVVVIAEAQLQIVLLQLMVAGRIDKPTSTAIDSEIVDAVAIEVA